MKMNTGGVLLIPGKTDRKQSQHVNRTQAEMFHEKKATAQMVGTQD